MPRCPKCTAALEAPTRFCPQCGAAQPPAEEGTTRLGEGGADSSSAEAPTALATPSPPAASAARGGAPSGPARGAGAYAPGSLIAGRYRIVGLLGRGGMGEVYRADDLKLDQAVALKFLPSGLERDPERLERFLAEVRTARRVTHPNVCRIHDIAEHEGRHFISMEYVDGDDLAALLRRIGRLPAERAVEVARQICAGLGAAHDEGILHRDLKPANVMLDAKGRVRLTDFGLAALADEVSARDVGSGTPGYMAPEQLAGREVTVQSDLYALGLLLHEIFTGQRVFETDSIAELSRLQARDTPADPASIVRDIDEAVERAILRCLERDPARRPRSAHEVAAALPGGDPLAAALAAGETPSPELVAAAGRREAMAPWQALGLALAALVLIVAGARWAGELTNLHYLPLDKRPEVLADRARELIAAQGYVEPAYSDPVDHAWGFLFWSEIITGVIEQGSSREVWDELRERPDALSFWYRQSPRVLLPTPEDPPFFTRGSVSLMNPFPVEPGAVSVLFDGAGDLRRFEVAPKRFTSGESSEPKWRPLFEAAGLDMSRFEPAPPRYQRFLAPDLRRAWVGTREELLDVPLRVEAGAFEGRVVLFNVAPAASLAGLADDPAPQRPSARELLMDALVSLLIFTAVLIGVVFSSQNVGAERADMQGAMRFGLLLALLYLVAQALRSHALYTSEWPDEIWPLIVAATFLGVMGWGTYTAVEPLGRRVWPQMFVSTSRLLSGARLDWRDPFFGKSVLVGMLVASFEFVGRGPLRLLVSDALSDDVARPLGFNLTMLQGQREALAFVIDHSMTIGMTFLLIVVLVAARRFVPRKEVALGLTIVVWTLFKGPGTIESLVVELLSASLMMFVLLRWGAVALVVSQVVLSMIAHARFTDLDAWHAQPAQIALAALFALAGLGTWAAMSEPDASRSARARAAADRASAAAPSA